MHGDLQGVCAVEVRTALINRDEDERRGTFGRENCVKEQETVRKHDSSSAIDVSEGSSAPSEGRGPVLVAGGALQVDAPEPGQRTLGWRKKGSLVRAIELTLRSIVSFSKDASFSKWLFFGNAAKDGVVEMLI